MHTDMILTVVIRSLPQRFLCMKSVRQVSRTASPSVASGELRYFDFPDALGSIPANIARTSFPWSLNEYPITVSSSRILRNYLSITDCEHFPGGSSGPMICNRRLPRLHFRANNIYNSYNNGALKY